VLRAIVFDFDGVIANSEPLHFRAFRDALARAGVGLTESEYYARYLGYDDVGSFTAIAADRGRAWSEAELFDLMRQKADRLEELERGHSVLFPGAEAAIKRLAAAYPLAIASGALRPEIVRVLERERLAEFFLALVSAEDTAASKPAPDPYLRAVTLLASATGTPLQPGECVAVEDSRWGLESARAAGLMTIAITHSYPADTFASAGAVIGHLDHLTPEFLGTLA
jgi:HAD superfamily hydrolase (TIGR01509 family)